MVGGDGSGRVGLLGLLCTIADYKGRRLDQWDEGGRKNC